MNKHIATSMPTVDFMWRSVFYYVTIDIVKDIFASPIEGSEYLRIIQNIFCEFEIFLFHLNSIDVLANLLILFISFCKLFTLI